MRGGHRFRPHAPVLRVLRATNESVRRVASDRRDRRLLGCCAHPAIPPAGLDDRGGRGATSRPRPFFRGPSPGDAPPRSPTVTANVRPRPPRRAAPSSARARIGCISPDHGGREFVPRAAVRIWLGRYRGSLPAPCRSPSASCSDRGAQSSTITLLRRGLRARYGAFRH